MAKKKMGDIDLNFIYKTQPQGGIAFKEEFYNRLGDSYSTCIHVYDTPTIMTEFWLESIVSTPNVTVIVDYLTDSQTNYKEGISKSIEEMESRKNSSKTQAEFDLHDNEKEILRHLNMALNNEGEQIKKLHIRIFVFEATLKNLEERVNDILIKIGSDGYKATVFLDEQKEEWQSIFLPYSEQLRLRNNREGMEMQAEALGLGFAHNQTFLNDESGFFYGSTRTGGTVYWDLFYKTPKRLYYNLFIAGDMGSGKSTVLKKIIFDNAAKGNFIRGFDKAGEFAKVVKKYGGHSVPLDGSKGIINMFQVYPSVTKGEDEGEVEIDVIASFRQHCSTLGIIYEILNPDVNDTKLKIFKNAIWDFYIEKGLWENPSIQITNLPNESYPTVSEFLAYINACKEMEQDKLKKDTYNEISISMRELTTQYGSIFDGTTTIPDLGENQVVFFDIGTLSQMDSKIFDCQMFIALQNIMANVMRIGKQEKEAYERKEKHFFDIRRFLIVVDECHNILNVEKAYANSFFVTLMSEARKFFGGIALATQRIQRMYPDAENASDRDMVIAANKLKEIFGLTQYKIIMKQDTTSKEFMKKLFGNAFSDIEYERMTKFQTGKNDDIDGAEGILSISGDQNLHMLFQVTEEELELFSGGA